ncbi:MAG: elongation factor G [Alkalilacustris sp.]
MRVLTILGPSQSGKTTLARHLAALEGAAPRPEPADHLALTAFDFMGEAWCVLDVAGGPETAAMAGGALMASDIAVLCVPPDPEAAMLAAPWLRAVEDASIPAVIFVNKMDAPRGRLRDVIAALQDYAAHPIVLRQIPIREGGEVVGAVDLISERAWRYRPGLTSTLVPLPPSERDREAEARTDLLEHLSDFDDDLLAELIEDREPATAALYSVAARETAERAVLPAFLGAAEGHHGVMRLMKALRHEAPQVEALRERLSPEATAVAFHGQTRKHLGKVTHLRALAPGVAAGTALGGATLGALTAPGGGAVPAALPPGTIAIAVKSDHLPAGRALTAQAALPPPAWLCPQPPRLARLLMAATPRDEVRLSTALQRLADTDPWLAIEPEPGSGHPLLRCQGPMHLRRILAHLAEDFGIEVTARPRPGQWHETISRPAATHHRHRKQTGGAGQFADVALSVAPQPRGAGFAFAETVKGGAVPRNYIPAVEEGAREAMDAGPLGFAVVDVAVTLTDGKHHAVDSSDHAFRTAGRMAVREALAEAGPVLLQPIARVRIHVPSACSGSLVGLVSGLKGQVLGFDADPDRRGWDIFRALLPETAEDDLLQALAAATQGTGWIESRFDHHEELHGREAEAIRQAHLAETPA